MVLVRISMELFFEKYHTLNLLGKVPHTSPTSTGSPTNPIPLIPGMGVAVMGGICPTLGIKYYKEIAAEIILF